MIFKNADNLLIACKLGQEFVTFYLVVVKNVLTIVYGKKRKALIYSKIPQQIASLKKFNFDLN